MQCNREFVIRDALGSILRFGVQLLWNLTSFTFMVKSENCGHEILFDMCRRTQASSIVKKLTWGQGLREAEIGYVLVPLLLVVFTALLRVADNHFLADAATIT